jgi:hypothetical protein
MICAKCNTSNNYYHNYCYYCGERLETAYPEQPESASLPEPAGILLNKRREWFNPYRDRKIGKKRAFYAAILTIATMAMLVLWRIFLA